MTRRVLRELRTDEAIADAVTRASGWGYPRPIEPWEIDGSVWCTYGPDVVLWFQADVAPEVVAVAGPACRCHLIIAPESRRRVYGRPLLAAIELMAGLLEADAVWVSGVPADVAGYLERLRWIAHPLGWYKALGGVCDGQDLEAAEASSRA